MKGFLSLQLFYDKLQQATQNQTQNILESTRNCKFWNHILYLELDISQLALGQWKTPVPCVG